MIRHTFVKNNLNTYYIGKRSYYCADLVTLQELGKEKHLSEWPLAPYRKSLTYMEAESYTGVA